jgi:hypothetical protein
MAGFGQPGLRSLGQRILGADNSPARDAMAEALRSWFTGGANRRPRSDYGTYRAAGWRSIAARPQDQLAGTMLGGSRNKTAANGTPPSTPSTADQARTWQGLLSGTWFQKLFPTATMAGPGATVPRTVSLMGAGPVLRGSRRSASDWSLW